MFVLLASSSMLHAQHWISTGLRGGAGINLVKGNSLKSQLEPSGMLDVDYTYYWRLRHLELGIQTGVLVGYTSGGYLSSINEAYSNTDYLGNQMDYTITASRVFEQTHSVAIEVPVMFALRWQGLVFNAGVKVQVPVWYSNKQQISDDLSIAATYPAYGVTLVNQPITGCLNAADLMTSGRQDVADVSLLLSTEIGYEWTLTPADRVGLVAYFDGAPYCHMKSSNAATNIIQVAPISDATNPVPAVAVNTLVGTRVQQMNYLAFGVKVYYRFDVQRHMK